MAYEKVIEIKVPEIRRKTRRKYSAKEKIRIFFAGRLLMSLFTDEAAVVETGAAYLRIAAFILPSYVFLYVNVNALQGLKRPALAVWIGLARQIIVSVKTPPPSPTGFSLV